MHMELDDARLGINVRVTAQLSRYARLPRGAVEMLFPSERLRYTTLAEVLEELGQSMPLLAEASIGIISGLESMLGAGGPEMFSLTEWMNRFGHNAL